MSVGEIDGSKGELIVLGERKKLSEVNDGEKEMDECLIIKKIT